MLTQLYVCICTTCKHWWLQQCITGLGTSVCFLWLFGISNWLHCSQQLTLLHCSAGGEQLVGSCSELDNTICKLGCGLTSISSLVMGLGVSFNLECLYPTPWASCLNSTIGKLWIAARFHGASDKPQNTGRMVQVWVLCFLVHLPFLFAKG